MNSASQPIMTRPMTTDSGQQIFENLNTAVLAFDLDFHLVAINPAGENLLQVSARSIFGKDLERLLPDSAPLQNILEQAHTHMQTFTARGLHLSLAGGKQIRVDCAVSPILKSRQTTGLLVEMNQIDHLLRLTRDENAQDRQEANRAILKGLAHEIKNPLGGLRGAAQLLERELTTPELKEYTRIIIHEADRLRNLVDRMMGPMQPLKREPLNIHAVLEHVRKLLVVENPASLTIRHDYDPSVPEFIGDKEQMIQTILNIARNAVQAMESKGNVIFRTRIIRQFTIGQKRHRLVLSCEIEDNGPGIPSDIQEQIFYPMVTGRPEGTGLGLAIAQDIVSNHGGLIEMCSHPGQTIFTLYLPLEQDVD